MCLLYELIASPVPPLQLVWPLLGADQIVSILWYANVLRNIFKEIPV